jgi:hypothetical protein
MGKSSNETSVARCIPIPTQHATTTDNNATESRNGHATISLKDLALKGLQRNRQRNGHATSMEKPCNESATNVASGCIKETPIQHNISSSTEDLQPIVACCNGIGAQHATDRLEWYLSNRHILNPDEDLYGYKNSKLAEPMELVDLILKEKSEYWMRTNGDLEHCLEMIMRHVAGHA